MVRTHDSKWRFLLAGAPLLGLAFMVLAVLQGEGEVLRSPGVLAGLAVLAAAGAGVAFWTARQLAAAPTVPVARARAGLVALSGIARPVPGAAPLQSPDGEPCLWFTHARQSTRQYDACDSIRPFLLVDDSGACLVLPSGADVTGSSPSAAAPGVLRSDASAAAGAAGRTGRRLLCDGDALHVVGRYVPASAESLQRQADAAREVQDTEVRHATVRIQDPADMSRAAAAVPQALPPPTAVPPQALPVLCDPGAGQPYVIAIGRRESPAGLYRAVAVADALVMLGAGVPALWLLIGAR